MRVATSSSTRRLGAAAAWPAVARAQQPDRVRRIGVLMSLDENDPELKRRLSAFKQALADLGWNDGRNVRLDLRWGRGDINRIRALAQELVGLQPHIIVTSSTPATVALQLETRMIPIVFATVSDPVASGIVPRLDRPSGNITVNNDLATCRWELAHIKSGRRASSRFCICVDLHGSEIGNIATNNPSHATTSISLPWMVARINRNSKLSSGGVAPAGTIFVGA
jgi:ABC transporter substrate binding protein